MVERSNRGDQLEGTVAIAKGQTRFVLEVSRHILPADEVEVKLLEAIPTFLAEVRRTLESQYGTDSAEAFYANAIQSPEGMAAVLHSDRAEVHRLIKIAERHLSADYVERCLKPIRRPSGLVVEERACLQISLV
jgi:hypothetical protein